MGGNAKKWLMGCGIGCAGLIVLAVILIAVIAGYVRQEFRGVETAVESHRRLSDRFGEVESFMPSPRGIIAAERMEKFLIVRESLAPPGAALETALGEFQSRISERRERSWRVALDVIMSLGGLISPIGEYIERRNDALLAQEMGLGEYLYIYSLAYYSWLGNSPEDGPVVTGGRSREGRERLFGEDSTFGPRALRREYRRMMRAFLRNMETQASPEKEDNWHLSLERAAARLEDNLSAVVWEQGLPRHIAESLAPYRERLEGTYRPSINCFELPVRDDQDWRRWRR